MSRFEPFRRLSSLRDAHGIQARFDAFVLGSLFGRAKPVLSHTLLPVLVMAEGDGAAVRARHAAFMATLPAAPRRGSPRARWAHIYGCFVREFEWLAAELVAALGEQETEKLVVGEMARAIEGWIGFIKPRFASLMGGSSSERKARGMAARLGRSLEARVGLEAARALFERFSVAYFLVGPVEVTHFDLRGQIEMDVPRCAFHTVAGSGEPQTRGCLWVCKGACEQVFDASSPLQLYFEPRLPELGCKITLRWDGDAPQVSATTAGSRPHELLERP